MLKEANLFSAMKEALQTEHTAKSELDVASAYYDGKEEWKRQVGNRYTPAELAAMEKNWQVRLAPPRSCYKRNAD
jgi:hypothetical protein